MYMYAVCIWVYVSHQIHAGLGIGFLAVATGYMVAKKGLPASGQLHSTSGQGPAEYIYWPLKGISRESFFSLFLSVGQFSCVLSLS